MYVNFDEVRPLFFLKENSSFNNSWKKPDGDAKLGYALIDSIVSSSVIDRVTNDFSLEIEKGSILSIWELELGVYLSL